MFKNKRRDICKEDLLLWDTYKGEDADKFLAEIYGHAERLSKDTRSWYWQSIRSKRFASQLTRWLGFLLLLTGTALPLLAGLRDDIKPRLQFTQMGVVLLAIAGLIIYADTIFGWSSGWLRYVTTASAMEIRTRKFELEWGSYFVGKSGNLAEADVKPLFDLARQFEEDLAKLQSDETDKWVAEFNSGLALMGELIKSQREDLGKAVTAAQSDMEARRRKAEAESAAKADGALELTIAHAPGTPARAVNIGLDDEPAQKFVGSSWARVNLKAGQHKIFVETTDAMPRRFERAVVVSPGAVVKAEISLQS